MVVDASVWVSAFFPTDAHHLVSTGWLSRFAAIGDRLAVPTLALAEVAGAVARRSGVTALGEEAVGRLSRVPGLRMVDLDLTLAGEAAQLAALYRLRGADATYAALAFRLGVPLWTWDAEIFLRAGSIVRTAYPSIEV
ncbi:MAG: hypothetical protein A3F84_18975 [Candidatus Handelsmanbacteria bacterium RIFCSPLOWO2_12_FULL_64_10]|uniref:Ribonuclease VapC n=1 Tax=Handelsmanbacteria sp. (strain RIFCSPLOWO2_12_FULL_64_10) TaxID=1817868 RepID=A0A1F6D4F4_HANXR|nr:MAG: hypothetical protein A3F84_18975 [Candidatus Handelsmanbacteria bacterium RIFCSPLOWO2_12_FULL_64_10]